MRRYALSYTAWRVLPPGRLEVGHRLTLRRCASRGEAEEAALALAREKFPAAGGWGGHSALVADVDAPGGAGAPPAN